jgi:predicted acetyltransferase
MDGALDRGDYIWDRVFAPRTGAMTGYVVEDASQPGGIGGYVFLRLKPPAGPGRYEVHVTDLVATSPDAAATLWSFLAGFGSMAEDLVFTAGIMHPLFTLIDEPRWLRLTFKDYWMLRIVHVENALLARGYAKAVSAELHLDITDESLPANSGRYTLTVERGVPRVTRGGEGTFKADIRGLAQLYSGQYAPAVLATAGRIAASAEELDAARALFASSGGSGYCNFF